MSRIKLKILDEYPSNFRKSVLPTNRDVIKAIYYMQSDKIKFNSAIEKVSKIVFEIWNSIDVPCVTLKRIKKKAADLIQQYKKILKYDLSRRKNKIEETKFKVKKTMKVLNVLDTPL